MFEFDFLLLSERIFISASVNLTSLSLAIFQREFRNVWQPCNGAK